MIKYFYKNMTIYQFCKKNNLIYSNVRFSIDYYLKIDRDKELDDIIEMVITKYLKLNKDKKIINFINKIDKTNDYNFLAISKELNIEYCAMYRIFRRGFSKKEAFYIVWFLNDVITKKGRISISKKRIEEFEKLYYNKNYNEDTNILDALVMVKFGDMEAVNFLLNKRIPSILKIIKKNIFNKDYYKANVEDIKNEIWLKEVSLYKKICLNNIPQITKYLNIHARYTIIDYLKNNNNNLSCISLDKNIYDDKDGYDFIYNYDNYWEI